MKRKINDHSIHSNTSGVTLGTVNILEHLVAAILVALKKKIIAKIQIELLNYHISPKFVIRYSHFRPRNNFKVYEYFRIVKI